MALLTCCNIVADENTRSLRTEQCQTLTGIKREPALLSGRHTKTRRIIQCEVCFGREQRFVAYRFAVSIVVAVVSLRW